MEKTTPGQDALRRPERRRREQREELLRLLQGGTAGPVLWPWGNQEACAVSRPDLRVSDGDPRTSTRYGEFGPPTSTSSYDPGRIYSHLVHQVEARLGHGVKDDDTATDFRHGKRWSCARTSRARQRARNWGDAAAQQAQRVRQSAVAHVSVPSSVLGTSYAGQRIEVKSPHLGIAAFTYFRIVGHLRPGTRSAAASTSSTRWTSDA